MKRAIEIYDKIEGVLAGIAIGLALLICFVEVIARYFFSFSFYWAQEYILYFIIWSVFLGASQMLSREKHVRLELFVRMLPDKAERCVEVLTSCIIIVFGIMFLVSGTGLVGDSYLHHYVSTSLAKTPIWIPQLICPLAGVLFTFRGLQQLVRKINALRGVQKEGEA